MIIGYFSFTGVTSSDGGGVEAELYELWVLEFFTFIKDRKVKCLHTRVLLLSSSVSEDKS